MKLLIPGVCLLGILLTLPASVGADVEMRSSVIANGGDRAASTNYAHLGTIGQPAIGLMTGSYRHQAGIWWGGIWLTVGVSDIDSSPVHFRMGRSYPNPFNPTATLEFSIAEPCHVTIMLYDAHGRAMLTLVDQTIESGHHQTTVHADRLPSGVYYCRMTAGEFTKTQKMVLLK